MVDVHKNIAYPCWKLSVQTSCDGDADASRAPMQAAAPGLSAAQQPQIPALMNVSVFMIHDMTCAVAKPASPWLSLECLHDLPSQACTSPLFASGTIIVCCIVYLLRMQVGIWGCCTQAPLYLHVA